jgi:hypothetical protein
MNLRKPVPRSKDYDHRPKSVRETPTLRSVATQIRSISNISHLHHATIDQMAQHIQSLECRMSALEVTSTQAATPVYSSIQVPSQSMNNLRPRKTEFLPKLASRLIKFYCLSLFGLGLFLWLSIIFNVSVSAGFIAGIWDVFCRAGILLFLFFGIVAAKQSVH